VVGGSNPLTPTLNRKNLVRPPDSVEKTKVAKFGLGHLIR
jgi:hypothetical protein